MATGVKLCFQSLQGGQSDEAVSIRGLSSGGVVWCSFESVYSVSLAGENLNRFPFPREDTKRSCW